MLARMLRWVMTTPLGSAVAPEVKMISTTVSRVAVKASDDTVVAAPAFALSGSGAAGPEAGNAPIPASRHTGTDGAISAGRQLHFVADQHRLGLDDARDLAEEIGRGAVVDRHDDDAAQDRAPEGHDPFRPVLAPEDDFVVGADALGGQYAGERAQPPQPRRRRTTRGRGIRRREPETCQISGPDRRRSRGGSRAASIGGWRPPAGRNRPDKRIAYPR